VLAPKIHTAILKLTSHILFNNFIKSTMHKRNMSYFSNVLKQILYLIITESDLLSGLKETPGYIKEMVYINSSS